MFYIIFFVKISCVIKLTVCTLCVTCLIMRVANVMMYFLSLPTCHNYLHPYLKNKTYPSTLHSQLYFYYTLVLIRTFAYLHKKHITLSMSSHTNTWESSLLTKLYLHIYLHDQHLLFCVHCVGIITTLQRRGAYPESKNSPVVLYQCNNIIIIVTLKTLTALSYLYNTMRSEVCQLRLLLIIIRSP